MTVATTDDVRLRLTVEQSDLVDDGDIRRALDMAEQVRITKGMRPDYRATAEFAAAIVMAALRKVPNLSASDATPNARTTDG